MTDLVNLTPHPIRVYSSDTPDVVSELGDGLLCVIEPSGQVARVAETDLGTAEHLAFETYTYGEVSIPVELIVFTTVHGLPAPRDGVHLIVPLLTAIAVQTEAPGRKDLLVPFAQVRNSEGTVVGCRMLARPC